MKRPLPFVLAAAVFFIMGAQHRTQNFVINAPTQQIAQQVGQFAEHHRKHKSIEWLGKEMPPWGQPCPLQVQVTMEPPSGATTFQFGQGQILSMKMEINGPLDRLLHSVLPHEITHTILAYHFRQPVPRWADEGGSVLSEDEPEKERHDQLTRASLNKGQAIPLRRLFSLRDYPSNGREVMCLYAQGYSMVDYLTKRSNRQAFLAFLGTGMQGGWDQAVQSFYGHRSVEELEQAWLQHLKDTKRSQPTNPQVAQVTPPGPSPQYSASRPMVRMTAPPAQPLDPSPIVRGAAPSFDQTGQRFGDPIATTPPIQVPNFPGAVPYTGPTGTWQPVFAPQMPGHPQVQLGSPQFNGFQGQ